MEEIKRINSIDEFRGVTITLMFVANFIILFSKDPPLLLTHAQAGMVLPLDLVAPFFGFALGLSFPFLRDKVTSYQLKKRVVKRFILLYIIGKTPNYLYRFYFLEENLQEAFINSWSILETWAFGFIIVYILANLRISFRFYIAFFLVAIYQFLLINCENIYRYVSLTAEGGIAAVLSWSFLILLGTNTGEMIKNKGKNRQRTGKNLYYKGFTWGSLLIILAFVLHSKDIFTMARSQVNISYILLSAGFSVILFLIFHYKRPGFGQLFRNIGKYPLQAWVLQSLFYVPVYLTIGDSYFNWPIGLIISFTGVGVLVIVDEILIKLGIRLKV